MHNLFTPETAPDAKAVAAHAASVCELLAVHVSRLVGELGMRTLFARSLALASKSFPCFELSTTAGKDPFEVLRTGLEAEAAERAIAAASHVFETFVELLERFIGGGLVASLLHEVWPGIFEPIPQEAK